MEMRPRSRVVNGSEAVMKTLLVSLQLTERTTLRERRRKDDEMRAKG